MSEDRAKDGRFVKGHKSAGPGRPKGSRSKISEDFLSVLQKDFEEHGEAAVRACREEKPTEYVKVVAGLLPKEMILRRPEDEMSDSELAEMLDALRDLAVAAGISPGGDSPTHSGNGTAQ